MHSVTLTLFIGFLGGSDLWLVQSQTRHTNTVTNQTGFARQALGTMSHNQTRQVRPSPLPSCGYTIALLDFPPYIINKSLTGGFMREKLQWFVNDKCFNVERQKDDACNMMPRLVQNSDEMIDLIKNKSVDFAFPIQADAKVALKDEAHVTLIRAFVSPGCSLIVNTKQCEEWSRAQLLTSITSQWPILACIILLSGISGVVIWLLEHKINKAQFSPSFTVGSPEGFWWALVSLTTVGYGDKIPKSSLGRLFGVIWILVGAIMLSLFTAMATNAMNTALDGTKCKDIDGKEVGVFMQNNETQIVAKEFNAKIVRFSSLEEMQWHLSKGLIGRVLVDRNTAFYFLDKSGLKRNRQIRLIRYIDYPMYYYLAHVNKGVSPAPTLPPNGTKDSNLALAECGPKLREDSTKLVSESKETARNRLIPAELQTADLSDQMEGLFSTGSEMTRLILYCLLAVFLALVVIGFTWEIYRKSTATVPRFRKDMHQRSGEPGNNCSMTPLDRKMYVLHELLNLEIRLKDLTTDLQTLKEEFAKTIADQ